MPPRKKNADEEPVEPSRRSTRIKEMPPKPAEPADAGAGKKKKKLAKVDPDLLEYKPTRKTAGKKRKKAEADAGDAAADDEEKPKKKAKPESTASAAPAKAPASKVGSKPASRSASKPPSKAKHAGRKSEQPAVETIEEEKEEDQMEVDGKLTVGSALPSITLKNEKGEDVHVGELAKDKGVVIFAVPKANTPGCTKQACAFRDNYEEFTKLGYVVYGLSADSSATQGKWSDAHKFPYPLITDPKKEFITALGAKKGTSTTRSHFVFEKGTGKLLDAKIPVKAEESYKLALDFIKSH